nr:replication initiator protein A [uncultured Oscillibacter sp.]
MNHTLCCHSNENNQFSFLRIPRQLIKDERFKHLSAEAKLLYGLLLDRMALSTRNDWRDEAGRVYIYYTLQEIQEDLGCCHDTATKLLRELGSGKTGFGLIERIRQGPGLPAKIYVKQFATPQSTGPQDNSITSIFGSQDF